MNKRNFYKQIPEVYQKFTNTLYRYPYYLFVGAQLNSIDIFTCFGRNLNEI